MRRRSAVRELAAREGTTPEGSRRLETLQYREAGVIGIAQSFALIAGLSRDGIAMVAGLVRGLDNEDAARFAFLLATPIILAAGISKSLISWVKRQRRSGPGSRRQHCDLLRQPRGCSLPHAIFQDTQPDPVCDLLPGVRGIHGGLHRCRRLNRAVAASAGQLVMITCNWRIGKPAMVAMVARPPRVPASGPSDQVAVHRSRRVTATVPTLS